MTCSHPLAPEEGSLGDTDDWEIMLPTHEETWLGVLDQVVTEMPVGNDQVRIMPNFASGDSPFAREGLMLPADNVSGYKLGQKFRVTLTVEQITDDEFEAGRVLKFVR